MSLVAKPVWCNPCKRNRTLACGECIEAVRLITSKVGLKYNSKHRKKKAVAT